MGKVGFGELAFWLVAGRRPTPGEVRVFEAVLVALADHGFTPTAIAARLTYLSAPDSLQGALAAGLLGGGSRFLGVTEDCGRFLADTLAVDGRAADDDAGWDALALAAVRRSERPRRFVPGLGHPVHKEQDPRTPGADRDRRARRACTARTCGCSRRSAGCTRRCSAGRCRSTAPASAARRWPTSGCRSSCCAVSRCWPARPACSASSPRSGAARSAWTSTCTVDRNAGLRAPTRRSQREERRWPSSSRSSPPPTTPSTTRPARATGEDRPPFADEWVRKIEAFRETLTRAGPDVLVMVGSDHFHQLWLDNMPQFLVGKAPFYDANWYNEEREFGLPRMLLTGQRGPVRRTSCATGLDAGFDLAFSNELRIDHSITCPIITLRPAGRPADRADLHEHLRAAAAAAEAVRPARRGDPGDRRVLAERPAGRRSSAPATCRWSWAGRASSARTARTRSSTARAVEWIANGDLDGCLREVTLDSLHAPGNATHGFMDFMLMMGVAGEGAKADYVDTLDLFHTMEAYFTWYPNGAPAA